MTTTVRTNAPPSNSSASNAGSKLTSFVLELHIALSGGDLQHVVIGVPGERCDYFVYGDCMNEIGAALDLARPGELSIAQEGWDIIDLGGRSAVGSLLLRKSDAGHVTCERNSLMDIRKIAQKEIHKRDRFKEQARQQYEQGLSDKSLHTLMEVTTPPGTVLDVTNSDDMGGLAMLSEENEDVDNMGLMMGGGPGAWTEVVEFYNQFINSSLVHKLQQATDLVMQPYQSVTLKQYSGPGGGRKASLAPIIPGSTISLRNNDEMTQVGAQPAFQTRRGTLGPPQQPKNIAKKSDSALPGVPSQDGYGAGGGDPLTELGGREGRKRSLFSDSNSTIATSTMKLNNGPEILSEYRTVSVMFIKLHSHFNANTAHRAYSLTFNTLLQYDGVIQQFAVDDKGQSILIVFGLPPWGHENNALYALKAGVAIAESMQQEHIRYNIGVATGDLLFSVLGNATRSEAGLLGDVVNVSARLMSLRPESGLNILCDQDTKNATEEVFKFHEFGIQVVKGKTEPIQVWSVMGTKSTRSKIEASKRQSLKEKRTYGYAAELNMITKRVQVWQAMKEQTIIVLEAPTGMGKSTLAEKIVKEHKNVLFSCGQGQEVEKTTPGVMRCLFTIYTTTLMLDPQEPLEFARTTTLKKPHRSPTTASNGMAESVLFGHWVAKRKVYPRASFSAESGDGISSAPADVTQFLKFFAENPELAPLFCEVMPWTNVEENEKTKAMGELERRSTLHTVIIRIIEKMSECLDLAIVIDNAQFVDYQSMDIINSIAKSCPRALLMIIARPLSQYRLEVVEKILALPNTICIKLNGLSLEEAEELLVWKFHDWGAAAVHRGFLKAIYERSSGNPSFVDQLADSIYFRTPPVVKCDEIGVLDVINKTADLDHILVRNIESAVLVSFDQLNSQFQEVLRVASVFGQFFNFQDVAAVLFENVDELTESAMSSDVFQFLKPVDDSENPYEYCFRHINFNTAIYESLPFAQRQEIHLKIARHFESELDTENEGIILPAVSFHYLHTFNREKIYEYLEKLGDYRLRQRQLQEVAAAFEKIINFYENDRHAKNDKALTHIRRAAWLSMLGYAQSHRRHQMKDARDICLKALGLVGIQWHTSDDGFKRDIFILQRRLRQVWVRTLFGLIPFGMTFRARRNKETYAILDVVFRCLNVLREISGYLGFATEQEGTFATLTHVALALENASVYKQEMFIACVRAAQLYWQDGWRRLGTSFLRASMRTLAKLGGAVEDQLLPAAQLLRHRGETAKALELLRRTQAYAKRIGDVYLQTQSEYNICFVYFVMARFREGRALCSSGIELCDRAGDLVTKEGLMGMTTVIASLLDDGVNAKRASDGAYEAIWDAPPAFREVTMVSSVLYKVRTEPNAPEGWIQILSAAFHSEKSVLTNSLILTLSRLHSWKSTDLDNLFSLLKAGWSFMEKQGRANVECQLATPLYRFAFNLVSRRREGRQGDERLGDLVRTVRRKLSESKAAGNMALLRVIYYSVIGRFSVNAKEKADFSGRAYDILRGVGANDLAEWVVGGDYTFRASQ
ncbi:hypothetical protein HK101_000787 [Irineochytrium annulatum]|nr:hypothetical protein HK101_000787 [Irineochytrium annulatum]